MKTSSNNNKNPSDLKKAIHTMTTLLIHFSFPHVPCDSTGIYSFNSPKTINAIHHVWIQLPGHTICSNWNGCSKAKRSCTQSSKTRKYAENHSYIFNAYVLFTLATEGIARGRSKMKCNCSGQNKGPLEETEFDFWICLRESSGLKQQKRLGYKKYCCQIWIIFKYFRKFCGFWWC